MKWLFILLFVSVAYAEDFRFQMRGSYQVNTSPTPNLYNVPTTINFTLAWNEKDHRINGVYKDSYFAGNFPVSGSTQNGMRTFQTTLAEVSNGIKSISIISSGLSDRNGPISTTITVLNSAGMSLATANTFADLTVISPSSNYGTNCEVGFGALSKFCGLYSGSIHELKDTKGRCDISNFGTRFELATDQSVTWYFNYGGSFTNIPKHTLGTMRLSPTSPTLNVQTRNCGPLFGTTFDASHCLSLQLTGTFSGNNDSKAFTGTYRITDLVSNESCTLELDLTRQIAY